MSYASQPAVDYVPVATSDTVEFQACQGLYCVGDGIVRVLTTRDTIRSIPVKDGSLHPLQVKKVFASGTSGVTAVFAVYTHGI